MTLQRSNSLKGSHSTQLLLWIAGISILILITGCEQIGQLYSYVSSGPVGWRIKQAVRDKRSTIIDIAKLTDFQWDELYVLGPYQLSMEEICKKINVNYQDCNRQLPFNEYMLDSDGAGALVFKYEGKIVHAERYLSFHGRFRSSPQPIRRDQAVFVVKESGQESYYGEPWFDLIHQE